MLVLRMSALPSVEQGGFRSPRVINVQLDLALPQTVLVCRWSGVGGRWLCLRSKSDDVNVSVLYVVRLAGVGTQISPLVMQNKCVRVSHDQNV